MNQPPISAEQPLATGHLVSGGGEMGERMRAFDWAQTPLGALENWSASLRTAVSLLLNSRYPMFVWWGPELINLYNDAYIPVLGKRHPAALGRPAATVWTDIWETVGAQAAFVFRERRATWNEELLLVMERNGFTEETYFTFSYSPIFDEQGEVCALFCACTEETSRVLNRRRLRTLRQLAEQAALAQTAEAACANAAAVLNENGFDVPFALLYLLSADEQRAELAGTVQLPPAQAASPAVIDLTAETTGWPLHTVLNNDEVLLVNDLPSRFGPLPGGAWPETPTQAAILPLAKPGEAKPTGFLIAGFSPRLSRDDEYLGFLKLAAGHVATAVANARAFAAERQRAEMLAELNQAKTAFFSNISHEFRTPLTLLLAPLEEILSASNLSSSFRAPLEVAQRNGQRLLRLVNTLLDFSRLEAGRLPLHYEATELGTFTADLANLFRPTIEKAGLQFEVTCPPLPMPIHVDRAMWEKIVFNLLSNAFKFTLTGGISVQLQVETAHETSASPMLILTVNDTGVGIPENELPLIFSRFHRVQGSAGRSIEGSGIGLALVQELVKLHGGTISVQSTLQHGSTFTIRLPYVSAEAAHNDPTVAPTVNATAPQIAAFTTEAAQWLSAAVPLLPQTQETTQPGNDFPNINSQNEAAAAAFQPAASITAQPLILLADDNADMRAYVQRLLSQRWLVSAVSDGVTALAQARTLQPALILADVLMPGLNGFELLTALRADERTQMIPVILLSARAGEEARVEGIEAGADDYLTKPFSARELLARVSTHLELALSRRAIIDERERLLAAERQARASAEAATLAKDEFLSVISHELRSPLNSIMGYAHLLRSNALTEHEITHAASVIERAAKIQKQLIEDLLDTARVTSGKLRLVIRPVNLVDVIQQTLENIFPAAQAKGISLLPFLDEYAGQITGDPERLQQVVWNLLSNAVKYTPSGGHVRIKLARIDPHIQLVVSDTGKGIAPEFLPHIFDRFSQFDASSTRRYGGLGLGLALVKQLVELHGGTIEAFSTGVDQGAMFKVALPVRAVYTPMSDEAQAASASLLTPTATNELAGVRTLVVDDEADARNLVTELLAKHGALVTAVASAAEAFALATQPEPAFDLMVSDIGLPEEDGYSLLRRLRAWESGRRNPLPALALTAFGSSEDRIRALMAGFQMHVHKPVDAAELILVAASLANNRVSRASREI